MDLVFRDQDGKSEVLSGSSTPAILDVAASPASPSEPQRHRRSSTERPPNENKPNSRVKRSPRRAFLNKTVDEKRVGDAAETSVESAELDNSWTCPLTMDELSPSEAELENPLGVLHDSQPSEHQVQPKHCSGMILKLRKMLGGGLKRKKACYEAVSECGTVCESSLPLGDVGEVGSSNKHLQKTPKVAHKWKGKRSFSHAFRSLGGTSNPNRRSLLKNKYCPYLSVSHSAEHRRRLVLRSAVQRARGAMRTCYPDLVGKKIRHLYEEDDKSEVWYRGEVLRVHEAHANPMKTIFEVRYDSEPEWKYYLELLIDYKKGWLKIEDQF